LFGCSERFHFREMFGAANRGQNCDRDDVNQRSPNFTSDWREMMVAQ
jgi:hypothetical protein